VKGMRLYHMGALRPCCATTRHCMSPPVELRRDKTSKNCPFREPSLSSSITKVFNTPRSATALALASPQGWLLGVAPRPREHHGGPAAWPA
jgi:hypothetical protein